MMRRLFVVVYTFDRGIGEFLLEGIFTKRDDAVALALEINPTFVDNGNSCGPQASGEAVYILDQSRAQIAEYMVSQRFAQLYEPLRRLAGTKDEPKT